jgi:MATE family multidrug resistance protein
MGPATSQVTNSVDRPLRVVITLSLPVIIAELGWMFMGVVDTIMVGPMGPTAIGAVSIGGILFDVLTIFGIGLMLGLDTLVSQAWGARRPGDCNHSLWQGMYLALALSPVLLIVLQLLPPLMRTADVHQGVLGLAVPYMKELAWGLPPLLFYAALRRYLQGIGLVRPVMLALVTANVVNALGNHILIPMYGVEGAGRATSISRVYMMLFLGAYAVIRDTRLLHAARLDLKRIRALLTLGLPAAGQTLLEVGVFAAATVLAGRLTPDSLAAHHIVLNLVGTTFMVTLGISSAGAVLVGQAIGRGDPKGAKHLGWLSIKLGAAFMICTAALFTLIPVTLIRIFTKNLDVLDIAVPLLMIAAAFQLFDGIQGVTTGVLRGAGNTRTPMFANLVGHWLLGLPIGYLLCFTFGQGVTGLWIGLSAGLIVVGAALLLIWHRARF